MSLRDLDQNRDTLATFKGRSCFATLATNSIKLHIDDNQKKGCYIWIDPPWVFSRAWEEITSSDGYTEREFKMWCEKFSPLRDAVFEDHEENESGAITFRFSGEYRLFLPAEIDSEEDDESWYDHWYASDENGV